MARIVLYSNDTIGERMAGPGIRYVQMAKALAKHYSVLLLAPAPSELTNKNFQFRAYRRPKDVRLLIEEADVVIAQKLPPVLIKAIRRGNTKYIADFYDPVVLENLEANRDRSLENQTAIYNFEQANQCLQLAAADHILAASERQRDFWLGVLMQMGRVIPEVYNEDTSLINLFSIVPFGISQPPTNQQIDFEAMKELVPNFKKDDKIVLWGGGIWNWFDPMNVIEAIGKLKNSHPEIKLLFLGTKHPNPDAPEMAMTGKAVKLATDMGLVNRSVFFNYSWVPYDQRYKFICSSWIGISTHFNHTETRLSFRTRIIDSYIWGGLPTIATRGDSLADLIERRNLGVVVDYLDSDGIAAAMRLLAEDEKFYRECQKNIAVIQKEFSWSNLVKPIAKLIEKKNWSTIAADNSSIRRLILNYYKTGLVKVKTIKGWPGVIGKILTLATQWWQEKES